jgi:hypothetical protein
MARNLIVPTQRPEQSYSLWIERNERMRYALSALLLAALIAFGAEKEDEKEDDMVEHLEKVRKKVLTQGKVCPDPARPCPQFKAHELSFSIKQKFKFDRGEDRSQPFYAVILRSAMLCSIPEEEREKVQALFPARKVFVHRHFCEGFSDKVSYTNINRKVGFIAVYAGETEEEARRFLAEVKAGQFADANLRRMQAVVTYQLE